MALTRAALREMGVAEKEIIDAIMAAHGETIEAAKEKAKEDAEKLSGKIAALQEQLNNVPKPDPSAPDYKAELEALKVQHAADIAEKDKEFSEYKAGVETREALAKKQSAIMQQLEADGANPKLTKLLMKEFDLEKVELDGEKVKDWDAIAKPVKEGYADVFGTTTTKGADVAAPPAGTGGGTISKNANEAMNNLIRGKGDN